MVYYSIVEVWKWPTRAKKTHTDQYLQYTSHHPLHQKKGVIKTLMNRCQVISMEDEDKKKEKEHLTAALKKCGYPAWMVKPKETEKNQGQQQ